MGYGEVVEAVRIATSALNLIAFVLLAAEAAAYRRKIKKYDRLMREAIIIPGTRDEVTTELYADDELIERESVICHEAELDGELIKVVKRL